MSTAGRSLAFLAVLTGATLVPRAGAAGNLTSPAELEAIVHSASRGVASAVAARSALHTEATRAWRWGSVAGTFVTTLQRGEKACHPAADPSRIEYLKEGAPDAYAKVLAYHLETESDDARRLALAAEARDRVLELLDTDGFHGLSGLDWSGSNQCILELGISIPVWIETALLLEHTPVWTSADRGAFARWLSASVYPKVAWASRVRRNNWGAAGSLSASLIARYVNGEVGTLSEVEPSALQLDPPAAWAAHEELQLARIGTLWAGDSACARYGIQDHGGIPDELRRGAGGCAASFVPAADDAGLTYQTMHVELLVYHAEALRRMGSDALFRAPTPAGDPAILKAILFVIDNPSAGGLSWPWGVRAGALELAFRVYGDARLKAAAARSGSFRGGRSLPYATFVPPFPPQLLGATAATDPSSAGAPTP